MLRQESLSHATNLILTGVRDIVHWTTSTGFIELDAEEHLLASCFRTFRGRKNVLPPGAIGAAYSPLMLDPTLANCCEGIVAKVNVDLNLKLLFPLV